jgi:fatty-acyl-CoA synthase
MLISLLDHPDVARRDLSSLATVISGAASVPAELVRRTCEATGTRFTIVYGQTEMHGILTQTSLDDLPKDQATTIGTPLPQVEVKIADPATGVTLPVGEQGEICARGYQTMLGYFEKPVETAAAISEDGWLRSGDLGTMDARGYLTITGKLKDMIVRGGEKIYPVQVEELLFSHPAISEVAVFGVPHARWGEQVAAAVRLVDPAAPPSADELRAYCRTHLAAYKAPSLWFFVDAYPLTPSGKVQKFMLRRYVEEGRLQAQALGGVGSSPRST